MGYDCRFYGLFRFGCEIGWYYGLGILVLFLLLGCVGCVFFYEGKFVMKVDRGCWICFVGVLVLLF